MRHSHLLTAVLAFSTFGATANAETASSPCSTLVKECFAYSDSSGKGDAQTKCFYEKGIDPVCQGTPLGSLVMHRWGMSASATLANDGADLLTGPAMVDQDCLDQFDSTLSARMIQDELSREAIASLREALDKCAAVASPDDLSRP